MTDVDWNSVAELIAKRIWSAGKTVDLNEIVPALLEEHGQSKESQTVLERFDQLKQRVWSVLTRRITRCLSDAIVPRLKNSDIDRDWFIAQPHSSPDVVRQAIVTAVRTTFWRQFELLSVYLLKLSG